MCLLLEGEVRQVNSFQGKQGKIEVLKVLAVIGKHEQFIDVANFSDTDIKTGPVKLNVVPRVKVMQSDGRAFLNWATFDGVVK